MNSEDVDQAEVLVPAAALDPLTCFERVHDAYRQAVQAVGDEAVFYYRIAGFPIQLRFAGPGLVPLLTPALEHLVLPAPTSPALTICLWDSVSTGTACPPLPWREFYWGLNSWGEQIALSTPRGDFRGFNDDRMRIQIGPDLFNWLDMERSLALYWCQDAGQLPYYEGGAPLRSVLHWWFHARGLQLIHAGAVGTEAGGVLLGGKGGMGKSTTALACLNSELVYVSDDYTLLQVDPSVRAHSLYNTAKVNADDVHWTPHILPALSNPERLDTEKALFFLYPRFQDKIVASLPIRAVLLPQVTGRPETAFRPASPREALQALALSTLRQLAGAGGSALRIIDRLVRRVPSYHLELGTDMKQIPQVILELLSGD